MSVFKKNHTSVEDQRKMEQLIADNEALKANVEYLAMMADIDLDETAADDEDDEDAEV